MRSPRSSRSKRSSVRSNATADAAAGRGAILSSTGSRSSASPTPVRRGRGGSADTTSRSTSRWPTGRSSAARRRSSGPTRPIVPTGPQAGFRALAGEETLARTLLAGLTPDERKAAIVDDRAPADILTEHAARADVRSIPVGIMYRDLAATARADLERLIRHYVDRVRPDVAAGGVGADRRRRAGRDLVRVGGSRGAGSRPLLRHPRPAPPHRVRQHAERREPHPRGLARPRQRLGRGPPREALRSGALRRVT